MSIVDAFNASALARAVALALPTPNGYLSTEKAHRELDLMRVSA
jgi:hypothetical protein